MADNQEDKRRAAWALAERPPSEIRRRIRRAVPFAIRSGVHRIPHLLRWMRSPTTIERASPTGNLIAERSSPLRRPNTTYTPKLQAAKEANVRRVARAFHGIRVAPHQRLDWHQIVGPPLRLRGFSPGPELHDGALATGVGGGACQVANLLFWLGARSGLTLVERHRHGLDLFADHQRSVPFGCGATVFYPHRNLVFTNPHSAAIRIFTKVIDGHLIGRIYAEHPLDASWELIEIDHRFFRRDDAIWRSNTILRRTKRGMSSTDEVLVENLARVMYPLPPHLLDAP